MKKEKNKQDELKKLLRERIRDGVYAPETCLPSGLDLARELGTSYVTMTRVFKALEKEGFLTAIRGKGTFVNLIPRCNCPGKRIVYLIVQAIAHPTIEEIVTLGQQIFSSAGWQVNVVRVAGRLSEVKELILNEDAYFLIFNVQSLEETFGPVLELVHKRILLLGDRLYVLPRTNSSPSAFAWNTSIPAVCAGLLLCAPVSRMNWKWSVRLSGEALPWKREVIQICFGTWI